MKLKKILKVLAEVSAASFSAAAQDEQFRQSAEQAQRNHQEQFRLFNEQVLSDRQTFRDQENIRQANEFIWMSATPVSQGGFFPGTF